MRYPVILIDNGHGKETPGKRSPDGRFREYAWTREIATRICDELTARGYTAFRLVKEDMDVSLVERVAREHSYCRKYGTNNVILLSVHNNAAGSGARWMKARGWSAYTTKGITKADTLAKCLYEVAPLAFRGQTIRKYNGDLEPDFEENFYILKKSYCPAVLTENFFQDNWDDVVYLTSETGKASCVRCHVEGIINYITKYWKG